MERTSRKHVLRRSLLSAAATATIIGALAVPSDPAFAAGTSTVTGHLTDASGAPLAGAAVYVQTAGFQTLPVQVSTDASGAYTATGLDAGEYVVSFTPAGSQFTQYAYQQRSPWAATHFTVAAGGTVVVNDQAIASGRIAGSLHRRDGSPAGGVQVGVYAADGSSYAGVANTAADGTFSVELLPGEYKVNFRQDPAIDQWNGGAVTMQDAAPIVVTAGQATPLTETLIATGSIGGRLLGTDGTPAAGMSVTVIPPSGPSHSATTGADGRYRVDDLPPRDGYSVAFRGPGGQTQWAHAKLDIFAADHYAVVADQVTTVDEQLLPVGSVRIIAHDATTGAPLTGICAWGLNTNLGGCTQGAEIVVADVLAGTYRFSVTARDHRHFDVYDQPVTVAGGQTGTVDVALRLGASLTVPMTVRASGALADGCARVARTGAEFSAAFGFGCSDWQEIPTPGSVVVGPLEPGTYQVYADPRDDALGAQWVGAAGGTGDRDAAASVTLAAGDQATATPARFDGAGAIRGTVTDLSTGAPVPYVCVLVLARTPDFSGEGCDQTTGDDGTYTIAGLGPYAWPVQFSDQAHQWRWSGNAVSRPEASKVTVKVGRSATANIRLRTGGGTVSGSLRDPAGHTLGGTVIAYNAVTGEAVSLGAQADAGGHYTLPLLAAPQPVKVFWSAASGSSGWVGGTDFASATAYQVRNNRTTTVDITVP